MLTAALLTLTLTADGDLRLSLSEMESAADCMESRDRVVEILTQAEIGIVEARCGEISLRLTPFEHGADREDEIHFYQVVTGGVSGFVVMPVNTASDCVADPNQLPRVYCARSAQSVIPDN